MKKIESFLLKAASWKVYGAVAFTMFLPIYGFTKLIVKQEAASAVVPISLVFTAVFALMVTTVAYLAKESAKFWEAARELEAEIEAATTRKELEHIAMKEFGEAFRKSQGGPHNQELNKLMAIIITKHKYMGEKV